MEFTWTVRNGSPCAVNQSRNGPTLHLPMPKLAWRMQDSSRLGNVKGSIKILQTKEIQFLWGRISNMNTKYTHQLLQLQETQAKKHILELCKEFFQLSTRKMDNKDICDETVDFSSIVDLLPLLFNGLKSVRISSVADD